MSNNSVEVVLNSLSTANFKIHPAANVRVNVRVDRNKGKDSKLLLYGEGVAVMRWPTLNARLYQFRSLPFVGCPSLKDWSSAGFFDGPQAGSKLLLPLCEPPSSLV